MKKHPDKHIRAALEYAMQHGWEIVSSGKSALPFALSQRPHRTPDEYLEYA